MSISKEDDIKFIERSIALSRIAVERGNHPFGCLLVDPTPHISKHNNNNNNNKNHNQHDIKNQDSSSSLSFIDSKNQQPDERIILEASNTVITENDSTRHAELNLVSAACRCGEIDEDQLHRCTLYTSTEPCCMCCGAIFWCDVGRIVYACSTDRLGAIVAAKSEKRGEPVRDLHIPARSILEQAVGVNIEVEGPIKEDEAAQKHEAYW